MVLRVLRCQDTCVDHFLCSRVICGQTAEPAIAIKIRPTVSHMRHISSSTGYQEQDRGGPHSLSQGFTGMSFLVDVLVGVFEGLSYCLRDMRPGRCLPQMGTKTLNRKLCC